MKNNWLLVALLAFSTNTYAECAVGTCAEVKITQMQIDVAGVVFVETSGTETLLNCSPEAGIYLKLNTTAQGGKNIYAALLATQARDQIVKIRVIDNVSPCEITYVSTY
jgi:hypothetical protein